jgi:CheY-like chemotaxis protein
LVTIRGGNERLTILLVEDDEADVFFFRRCLSHLGSDAHVHVVESATLARLYLEGAAPYTDRHYYPLPHLIIADLNLGIGTAHALCEWIFLQPAFKHIPCFVYTGRLRPADEALLKGFVTGVYQKNGDFSQAQQTVSQMLRHLPSA